MTFTTITMMIQQSRGRYLFVFEQQFGFFVIKQLQSFLKLSRLNPTVIHVIYTVSGSLPTLFYYNFYFIRCNEN